MNDLATVRGAVTSKYLFHMETEDVATLGGAEATKTGVLNELYRVAKAPPSGKLDCFFLFLAGKWTRAPETKGSTDGEFLFQCSGSDGASFISSHVIARYIQAIRAKRVIMVINGCCYGGVGCAELPNSFRLGKPRGIDNLAVFSSVTSSEASFCDFSNDGTFVPGECIYIEREHSVRGADWSKGVIQCAHEEGSYDLVCADGYEAKRVPPDQIIRFETLKGTFTNHFLESLRGAVMCPLRTESCSSCREYQDMVGVSSRTSHELKREVSLGVGHCEGVTTVTSVLNFLLRHDPYIPGRPQTRPHVLVEGCDFAVSPVLFGGKALDRSRPAAHAAEPAALEVPLQTTTLSVAGSLVQVPCRPEDETTFVEDVLAIVKKPPIVHGGVVDDMWLVGRDSGDRIRVYDSDFPLLVPINWVFQVRLFRNAGTERASVSARGFQRTDHVDVPEGDTFHLGNLRYTTIESPGSTATAVGGAMVVENIVDPRDPLVAFILDAYRDLCCGAPKESFWMVDSQLVRVPKTLERAIRNSVATASPTLDPTPPTCRSKDSNP
jgi:hypothetical protein